MLFPIKAVCQQKDIRRDRTSVIFIQYCYSATNRTFLNTGLAIPPEYWDKKKSCVKPSLPIQYGDATALNKELIHLFRVAEDLILFANKNNVEDKGVFVKANFKVDLDIHTLSKQDIEKAAEQARSPKHNTDFYFQLDDYIQSKKTKVSKATIGVLNCIKQQLKQFDAFRKCKTTFDSLDFNFYDALITFLTYDYVQQRRKTEIKGLKINSIGKTVKQLRVFVRDRVRRKLVKPVDLSDFKIPEEEPDAIYLSYEEVAAIYNLNLNNNAELKAHRDMFVLACLTGLRFSDFSRIQADDVRKGLLHKKQEKSEHWVVVPLREEARQILNTYSFSGLPKLSNPIFNLHIKTLGQLAGMTDWIKFSYKKGNKTITIRKNKFDWITSHTARRSFCTNEFLAGTPVKLIMKISGHKKEKDFYKYIRITPEEAAQKIQELWEKRGGMSAFGNQHYFKNCVNKKSGQ